MCVYQLNSETCANIVDLGGTMVLHINKKIAAVALILGVLITLFANPQIKAKASLLAEKIPIGLSADAIEVNIDKSETLEQNLKIDNEVVVEETEELYFSLKATGYNSLENQTDSTPFITSTGARTKFGIIAVSRDLLSDDIPYGSLVRIKDLGNYYNGRGAGKFQSLLDDQEYFIVEDTMHKRKKRQIDVWFPRKSEALSWGVRQVELEVVRYGRSGPFLSSAAPSNHTISVD